MKRIIIHWTAGGYQPNSTDKQHYHFLINGDGEVTKGKFPVQANAVCLADNKGNALYAAHCGGGNTGSIGIALCGMCNFNGKPDSTKYGLKRVQLEACFSLIAKLCREYKIPISKDTVMTHYEFGVKNPKTTSKGKIDITYLHPFPNVKTCEVGDFIRSKANWYYAKQESEV